MEISLAPVLTILARVLSINLHKARASLFETSQQNTIKPGDSPGSVNHKIDGVGHKIPDAEKKTKQARHKPHAEHQMLG